MSETALWLLIKDQKLLPKTEGEKGVVPLSSDLERLGLEGVERHDHFRSLARIQRSADGL